MGLSIIIVGAGPGGCFLAQSLRKALPESELTIMDRLPVPYGLIRYGVAPDHQGTKAVTRQFDRLFERQNIHFMGNVCLGKDVSLEELRTYFDVVVLSTGLSKDRPLGSDFLHLSHVYGAGKITRMWNGHPYEASFRPELGEDVVVIGNGNVAIDVVRLLAKGSEDFAGSDIHDDVLAPDVKHIHLVGRSPAAQAKFDPAMVRELSTISNLCIELGTGSSLDGDADNKVLQALSDICSENSMAAAKTLTLHFELPVKAPVLDETTLTGIVFNRAGEDVHIKCDSLISAIGFEDDGGLGRPKLLLEASDLENGQLDVGLYATGWFRRGPQGTIPENRKDAQAVAARIVADLQAENHGKNAVGRSALLERVTDIATTYQDWLAIDAVEREQAPDGRVRQKLTTVEDMLAHRTPTDCIEI